MKYTLLQTTLTKKHNYTTKIHIQDFNSTVKPTVATNLTVVDITVVKHSVTTVK